MSSILRPPEEVRPDMPTSPSPEPPTSGLKGAGEKKNWVVLWSSFFFAVLQSVCTAVIAISGIRVVLGISAAAVAAGLRLPILFHTDWIRLPMMLFALGGSLVNLYVVRRVRGLRKRSSSQWRQKPVPASKLRSETLQVALAIFTLILLLVEWSYHLALHHSL